MLERTHLALLLLALVSTGAPPAAQRERVRNVSGGELLAEQAVFDVAYYGLELAVDPDERTIEGSLTLRARLLAPSDAILLGLDDRLEVRSVLSVGEEGGQPLGFEHREGRLRIHAPSFFRAVQPGGVFELVVRYGGEPRVARRPPWDGGFSWKETADGRPWIATSCQGEGADLWWPCKDHPSDEPDEMDIVVTVPEPLVVATNGALREVVHEADGHATYRWHVSTPINNYGVALNIAPYETITRDYTSTAGDVFPVTYWVLPENLEQGKLLFEEILAHLRFFEETYGPYPFRADKYGVAETPHLGMEHQTIIAYGNRYHGNIWGPKRFQFDSLHHHELAHEWWGNLVTARSWEDMWIHEGFGTYAQALYVEKLYGAEGYREQMAYYDAHHANKGPVAPRRTMNTQEVYFGHEGDSPGGDIYNKGACVLHTLRWLLGDETFFRALRRMAYPDPALERTTDGSACRFTDTDEIVAIAEEQAGRDLGWFFEVYVRQPKLPRLRTEVQGDALLLAWETPGDLPFPLPVEVELAGERVRVPMEGNEGRLALGGRDFVVDPDHWLTKEHR